MLTIIKVSLGASALMLLTSCSYYQFGTGTSYQTPCLQGHICDCVQYTTVNRSWLDCRDYGRVKSKAYQRAATSLGTPRRTGAPPY
jgi:hypothetical protein